MKFLLASLLVAAAAGATVDLKSYTFEQYVRDFRKEYSAEESVKRERIFAANLAQIIRHNSLGRSWTEGVNAFTDLTAEEMDERKGLKKGMLYHHHATNPAPRHSKRSTDVPLSVDWRNEGVVTAVKDQGHCGSCWTFAAAETLESHVALATGALFTLSEQEFVSCVPDPQDCGGTGGCEGATAELAFGYAVENGLVSEWTTPYTSYTGNDGVCSLTRTKPARVAKITDFIVLEENSYDALIDAVSTVGPIAISVDASSWSSYSGGIFDGCNQVNPDIDHAVVLVGYGTDPASGLDYWLVRNSWGPTWGENGYIRLLRTPDEQDRCGVDITPLDGSGCPDGPANVTVCGTCGVLYDSSYPTGAYLN